MTEVVAQLPRVLIVDDSRMVRASLSKQIRDKFDIREEADGEAGWQALLLDPTIEVVISDIGMPRLDGFGLLQRIRGSRLSRINSLPVLIISGEDEDEVQRPVP
jgi:PleD family two-component response regulator